MNILEARSHDVGSGGGRKSSSPVQDHRDVLMASKNVGDLVPVRMAVVSVSDKTGLDELGNGLSRYGVTVVATEGSAKNLSRDAKDLKLIGLTEYTNFPENFNGRLKTLHPKIQAGVLAIKNYHDAALKKANAKYIDLVVVNLYPFEDTVQRGATPEECIENIDIGGPALLRGAAKNHPSVCVICDPSDYKELLSELNTHKGQTSLAFRRRCAHKAFKLTSKYDTAIAEWFSSQV